MAITKANVIVEWLSDTGELDKGNKEAENKVKKSTGRIRKTIKEAGDAIAGFFAGITIANAINRAAQSIANFELALDNLSSITGLTGKDIDELSDTAIDLSLRFGTSASEIVDGFGKVGSAIPELLSAPDALAQITKEADTLSKAAGITLDEAIEALTKTINQYGLEASDASRVTDVLATSQQKGTARITSISEALKNVGSVAAASNVSFENTNVLLQALAKGGLEGAEAGTALRSILLRLSKTGREELNPATQDFNDILEVLSKEVTDVTKAAGLFGEEAAAAGLTLIEQRGVVDELTGALFEQGNALSQALTNTDNNTEAVKRAAAAWDALILSIDNGNGVFSQLSRSLLDGTTDILGLIKGINDGIDSWDEFIARTTRVRSLEFDSSNIIDPLIDIVNTQGIAALSVSQLEEGIRGFELALEATALRLVRLEKGTEQYNFQLENQRIETENLNFFKERLAELTRELADATEDETDANEESVLTLGKLRARLAELNKARDNITIGDNKAFRENEKLIRSVREQIKQYEIRNEQEKRSRDLAAQRLAAERSLQALRIALIEDENERAIAALRLRAQRQIDTINDQEKKTILSASQAAEARRLIAEKVALDIVAIREEESRMALEKVRKALEAERRLRESFAEFFARTEREQQQEIDDIDEFANIGRQLRNEQEVLGIKQKVRDKILTEKEGEAELAKQNLAFLREQLNDLSLNGIERLRIEQQIADAEIAIEKAKAEEKEEIRKENLEAAKKAVGEVISSLSEVFDVEADRIQRSISLQEERVEQARVLAERGSAAQLEIEEERLDKLLQARERAARRQRILTSIEIAANTALAISEGITALIAGFKEGNIFKGIANAVALAATVTAGIISIKNSISDVPAFATGVDMFRGAGTTTSDSNLIRISDKEGIIPAKDNIRIRRAGITNKDLAKYAIAGQALSRGDLAPAVFGGGGVAVGQDMRKVEQGLASVESAINRLNLETTTSGDQLSTVLRRRNRVKNRRKIR